MGATDLSKSIQSAQYLDGREFWLATVAAFALLLIGLQVAAQGAWGFHRDEFLYMAMARRVDWGYWSNPPLIGAVAWLADNVTDSSQFAVRLFPLAASIATMTLTAAMARDLGGKAVATVMACVPFVVSPGLLRPGGMLQPVVFDILFWTAMAWIVVRYLRTMNPRWLIGLGVVVGTGFLNKYSIVFLVVAMLAAVFLSSHRRRLISVHVLVAVGIAALIALPNVLWQAGNGWPVIAHMNELAETQLVNVERIGFLLEQVLIHFPVFLFWAAGLVWLLGRKGRQFRVMGYSFVIVVLLLLLLRGKAYYTLGAYPVLFAAGAVWIEQAHAAIRWAFVLFAAIIGIALSPFSAAYLPVETMIKYGESFVGRTGIDGPLRWETGVVHELPQDYADMLGWEEMADLAIQAYQQAQDPSTTMIFADNYGEAGAVEYYGRRHGLPEVVSFADSYRLWAPDSIPRSLRTLIYVGEDDETELMEMFGSSRIIGRLTVDHAREEGATVFVFEEPDSILFEVYAGTLARLKRVQD